MRNLTLPIIFFIFFCFVSQAYAQIDGVVFRDFNGDGQLSAGNNEAGIGNIEVTAYDDNGVVGSSVFTYSFVCTAAAQPDATCLADGAPALGSYSLAVPAGGPYRIEYTLPGGGTLDFLSAGFGGNTSVVFSSGPATGLDIGFQSSIQYCQDDPDVIGSCFPTQTNAGNTAEVLISLPYTASDVDPSIRTDLTLADTNGLEVGSVWGVAYNQINGNAYTSAALKRYAEVGTNGLGAIYEVDPNGAIPNASLFATIPNAGTVTHTFTGDFSVDRETDAYTKIGKVGIGDIDISDDGTTLYAMNLNNNGTLHEFNIATATEIAQYTVNDPGCSDPTDVRPWATKFHDGQVYIGVVCSEEAPGGSAANLTAHVMQLTPGGAAGDFTTILSVPLDYAKETTVRTCTPFTGWNVWSSNPATFPVNDACFNDERLSVPTPIFGDIEFDIEGSLIMSFIDRFGMQTGTNVLAPDAAFDSDPQGPLWYTYGGGDILRACSTGPGFIIEGNAGCPQGNEGPGDLEYYWGEHHASFSATPPGSQHEETALGSLAHLFGSGEIVIPVFDPLDRTATSPNRFNTFGYRWLDNATGGMVQAYELGGINAGGNTPGGGNAFFSKGVQLGDVELECKQSPVEVGNRIWKDLDGDGIQDPSEPPVAGVTVELHCDSTGDQVPDTLVATAITDAAGNYLFSSDPMRAADTTTSAIYNLGGFGADGFPNTSDDLSAGLRPSFDADADGAFGGVDDILNTCAVIIPNFAAQAPLNGCAESPNDIEGDATNSALDDIRDSDGLVSGSDVQIVFEVGKSGDNNHSFDFGFFPSGSIGDYVFMDNNSDGIQGSAAAEPPIPGVTVKLTGDGPDGLTGTADDISLTDVTDAAGLYLFDDLPFGTYNVMIDTSTLPAGKVQTVDASGPLDDMSDVVIDATTPDNLDQDFGYVDNTNPVGSIGDTVYMDNNSDGLQGSAAAEPGIPGVIVKLTGNGPDGVAGNADDISLTETTDAAGMYLFDNLPFGTYNVMIDTATLPAGKIQTVDASGPLDDMSDTTIDAATPDDLDQDFGYVDTQLGSIGDYVFMDNNSDGLQGSAAAEPPIPGVTVKLTGDGPDGVVGTADDISLTDVTDAAGLYLFDDLPFGAYNVMIDTSTLPTGKIQTVDATGPLDDMSDVVIDAAAPDARDQDFGYVNAPVGSIGDFVWLDANGDGVQDATEAPIDGVTVKLTSDGPDGVAGTADDISQTDVTANGGMYLFTSLPFGDYNVMIDTATLPPGVTQTFDADGLLDDMSDRTISAADPDPRDQDFGYQAPLGSIGDFVWLDANSDGVQDGSEAPLDGVTVKLTSDGPDGVAGTADDISQTTVTANGGLYLFSSLPFGDYNVMIDTTTLPAGVVQTFDADGILDDMSDRTIDATEPNPRDQDFGYFAPLGSIGDFVFLDTNADGIQDAGDVPIDGIVVKLTSDGPDGTPGTFDDVIQTTVTANGGLYLFDNLEFGDYLVMIDTSTLPPGVMQTFDDDGGLDNMSMRTIDSITPNPRDQDFGYTSAPVGSIGDEIFMDTNSNGLFDANELPLAGVTVFLTGDGPDATPGTADDISLTAETNAFGVYTFMGLAFGDYVVKVDTNTLPLGKIQTVDADGILDHMSMRTISIADPDAIDQDFGYANAEVGSIGNLLFCDENANGIADLGEDPLPGVTVFLTGNGPDGIAGTADDVSLITQTNATGNYLFTGLAFGDYSVLIDTSTLPAGKLQTADPDGILDSMSFVTIDASSPDDREQIFGFVGTLGEIGNFVFIDTNQDGIQDLGEPGLPGISVVLTSSGPDGIIGTADDGIQMVITDPNGQFIFTELPAGDYKVTYNIPSVYMITQTGAGTDPELDSNIDTGTLMSEIVTLQPGESNLSLDAGVIPIEDGTTVLWNGFCDQQNFIAMANICATEVEVTVELFGSSGALLSTAFVQVPAGGQVDYSVNDMPGFTIFDYGVVFLQANPSGCIQGTMDLFAPIGDEQFFTSELRSQTLGGLNNLFALSDGTESNACYGSFNTFNPSLNVEDAAVPTIHWLQLANLESENKEEFQVNRFDSQGVQIFSENFILDPRARRDIAMGHEDEELNRYGTIEVIPLTPGAQYEAQIYRYGTDLTTISGERLSSFDLAENCSTGSSETQYLSVSRGAGSNSWLELQNVENFAQTVTVEIYSNTGGLVETLNVDLEAKVSQHFNVVSNFNEGESGLAEVSSSGGTIVAKSTSYVFRADGRVQTAFTSEGRDLLRLTGTASYNTFRNQQNWARLFNISDESIEVTITAIDQLATEDLGAETITIEPHSGVDIFLNGIFNFGNQAVGQVGFTTTNTESLFAEVIRVENSENSLEVNSIESFAVR